MLHRIVQWGRSVMARYFAWVGLLSTLAWALTFWPTVQSLASRILAHDSDKWFLPVGLAFLLAASFLAWQDENRTKALALQAAGLPHFEGAVASGSSWSREDSFGVSGTQAALWVEVRNVGAVPSLVKNWRLFVPPMTYCNHPIQVGERATMDMPSVNLEGIQPGHGRKLPLEFWIPMAPEGLRSAHMEAQFQDVQDRWHSIPWML